MFSELHSHVACYMRAFGVILLPETKTSILTYVLIGVIVIAYVGG